ncbi:MAG: hypothetical protein H0W61_14540 [Bacteroidetes bacterium]|nr:hypothetical protein [Bacteroidota bacterium]
MEEIKEHIYKWYEFGCKDASYLKTKADYSTLNFSEKFLYNFHLATCKYCRRFVKQVNKIDALLKLGTDQVGLRMSDKKKLAINQVITENLDKK